MKMHGAGAGHYRGSSIYSDVDSHGVGGNQVVNNQSGGIPGTNSLSDWHPTVLYLLGLLIVEWIAFVVLSHYI